MSDPADIEKALRTAFIAALPASAGKTAFENQTFDPKGKPKWFAFHFLPNKPDVATLGLGGQDACTGIAQIDIHVPLGTGKEAVDADFLALRSAFTPSVLLRYGSAAVTIKSGGQIPGGPETESYKYIFSISWETRLSRP